MVDAMTAYRKRKIKHIIHGPDAPPAGLGTEVATAQDAKTLDEVCDQIMASSSTPPITKAPQKSGRVYVDGGFADNVPVRALSAQARDGRVLVLLTRPIPKEKLPRSENRLYLAPSRPSPVATWDYTSPEKLKEAFLLGRQDAEREQKAIEAFLSNALI
jgi:predicted patatin/cPLA2 family phospholipase